MRSNALLSKKKRSKRYILFHHWQTKETLEEETPCTGMKMIWVVWRWDPWWLRKIWSACLMFSPTASSAPRPTVSIPPSLFSSGSSASLTMFPCVLCAGGMCFQSPGSPDSGSCESDPESLYPLILSEYVENASRFSRGGLCLTECWQGKCLTVKCGLHRHLH